VEIILMDFFKSKVDPTFRYGVRMCLSLATFIPQAYAPDLRPSSICTISTNRIFGDPVVYF